MDFFFFKLVYDLGAHVQIWFWLDDKYGHLSHLEIFLLTQLLPNQRRNLIKICIWSPLNPKMLLPENNSGPSTSMVAQTAILEILTSPLLNTEFVTILLLRLLGDTVQMFSNLVRDVPQVVLLCMPEFHFGPLMNIADIGHLGLFPLSHLLSTP